MKSLTHVPNSNPLYLTDVTPLLKYTFLTIAFLEFETVTFAGPLYFLPFLVALNSIENIPALLSEGLISVIWYSSLSTFLITFSLNLFVTPFLVVAVIVVEPSATASIVPFSLTFAIVSSSDLYETSFSNAFSGNTNVFDAKSYVSPTFNVVDFTEKPMFLTS